MKIGYARVSTKDQKLEIQKRALKEAGCEKIYEEKISGVYKKPPALERALDDLRKDDIFVVLHVDRLARSNLELLKTCERIDQAGAKFLSLSNPWADTTSPAGRMVTAVFAGMAEFQRDLILENTRTGREDARKRGVKFGRPSKISSEQKEHIQQLLEGGNSVKMIAKTLGVHRATIYRAGI